MKRLHWATLIRKIQGRRNPSARFFKPTCVIAAIDLADEGLLTPNNINAQAIVDRFSDYVSLLPGDRANQGHKPLWALTNDGLWKFSSDHKILGPVDFLNGTPNSLKDILRKSDSLKINSDYLDLWTISKERRSLRDSMLLMLHESDSDSRKLIAPLFNVKHLRNPDRWPSVSVLDDYFQNLRVQLQLFESNTSNTIHKKNGTDPLSSSDADNSTDFTVRSRQELKAVDGIPSPIDYVWSDSNITIGPNSNNRPVFSNKSSRLAFEQRLEACKTEAESLLEDFGRRDWQASPYYEIQIKRYFSRLPENPDSGNILLADARIRTLREMFNSDVNALPSSLSSRLKILIQQHIALRVFYPSIEEFYNAVKKGHDSEPLPSAAIDNVFEIVKHQTPQIFDPSVSYSIDDVASEEDAALDKPEFIEEGVITVPPDPLGDLELAKAHDVLEAGLANRLWKIFSQGEKISKNSQAWIETYDLLRGPMAIVIDWIVTRINRDS